MNIAPQQAVGVQQFTTTQQVVPIQQITTINQAAEGLPQGGIQEIGHGTSNQ